MTHQRMVVIDRVQGKGAGGDFAFFFHIGQIRVQQKQLRITDQSCGLQLLGDGFHGVVHGDGDGHILLLTTESQYISGTDPQHTTQSSADCQNDQQPDDGCKQMASDMTVKVKGGFAIMTARDYIEWLKQQ